jgi:hypothetical protein
MRKCIVLLPNVVQLGHLFTWTLPWKQCHSTCYMVVHLYSHTISSYIAWCTFGSTSMYPSINIWWNATCKHSTRFGSHCSGLCHVLECVLIVLDFPWLGWAWVELSPQTSYGKSKWNTSQWENPPNLLDFT